MLTEEQINRNKEQFKELLRTNIVSVRKDNVDKLISKLENSDFFYAPASTKYHSNFKGGLCQHSLNVFNNLCTLAHAKGLWAPELEFNEDGTKNEHYNLLSTEALTVVALLHDVSKMNYYTETFRNEKVYSENGAKSDAGGRFDWVAVSGYCKKDDSFVYGNHEQTAEFMARTLLGGLSVSESVAILHHSGGMGQDSIKDDIPKIYSKYSLALLLHLADMEATYIDEA